MNNSGELAWIRYQLDLMAEQRLLRDFSAQDAAKYRRLLQLEELLMGRCLADMASGAPTPS